MSTQEFDQAALSERLQGLKRAMENVAAPERVEAAVIAAYRSRASRPVVRWWPRWVLAGAAAAVVIVVTPAALLLLLKREPAPAPALPPVAVERPSAPEQVAVAAPAPAPPRARPRQVVQEFIPLIPDQSWGPGESAQLVRVSMPRAALQSFGLPVDETRAFEVVRADIIVGQDMVPRAIRFVR